MQLPSQTIPDAAWRARLLLATTRLRLLFGLPDIHRALVQDAFMAEITPVLRTPDYLAREEALVGEWSEERPEASGIAHKSAIKVEKACKAAKLSDTATEYRVRLHLAAYRRLDAATTGDEVSAPNHWLLGEPHIVVTLSDGTPIKTGSTRIANYYPSAAKSSLSLSKLNNQALVREVEVALFPLLPEDGDLDKFGPAFEHWNEMAAMREFECNQKYPLFPRSLPMPFSGAEPPPGYISRFNRDSLGSVGADLSTVSMAGFSPYMAGVFADYCRSHTDALEQRMKAVQQLALDHLVRHLRDVQVAAA